jgi:hypothetical protein
MATTTGTRTSFNAADGVSLRDHLQQQLVAQRDYFEMRLASIAQATELAAKTQDARFGNVNEFRGALTDLSNRMATRQELDLQLDKLRGDIVDLKRSRDEASGKASQTSVIVSMLFGVSGLVVAIVGLLTR